MNEVVYFQKTWAVRDEGKCETLDALGDHGGITVGLWYVL